MRLASTSIFRNVETEIGLYGTHITVSHKISKTGKFVSGSNQDTASIKKKVPHSEYFLEPGSFPPSLPARVRAALFDYADIKGG